MVGIDFAAIHADDVYLDALGGAKPEAADALAVWLLAFRADVDADPIAEFRLDWFNGWAA